MFRKEQRLSVGLYKKIVDELEPIHVTFKRSKKSQTGMLRYTAEDADRIRAAISAIGFAGDNDLPVHGMAPKLNIGLPRLYKLCNELGITIRKLRTGDRPGELSSHITKEEYRKLGNYIIGLEDASGLQSLAQIAARAGVEPHQVLKHRGH